MLSSLVFRAVRDALPGNAVLPKEFHTSTAPALRVETWHAQKGHMGQHMQSQLFVSEREAEEVGLIPIGPLDWNESFEFDGQTDYVQNTYSNQSEIDALSPYNYVPTEWVTLTFLVLFGLSTGMLHRLAGCSFS